MLPFRRNKRSPSFSPRARFFVPCRPVSRGKCTRTRKSIAQVRGRCVVLVYPRVHARGNVFILRGRNQALSIFIQRRRRRANIFVVKNCMRFRVARRWPRRGAFRFAPGKRRYAGFPRGSDFNVFTQAALSYRK